MKINNQHEVGDAILNLQNFIEELTKDSVNGFQYRVSSNSIAKSVKSKQFKSILADSYWRDLTALVNKVILIAENKSDNQETVTFFNKELTEKAKNLPTEKINDLKNSLVKINNFYPT